MLPSVEVIHTWDDHEYCTCMCHFDAQYRFPQASSKTSSDSTTYYQIDGFKIKYAKILLPLQPLNNSTVLPHTQVQWLHICPSLRHDKDAHFEHVLLRSHRAVPVFLITSSRLNCVLRLSWRGHASGSETRQGHLSCWKKWYTLIFYLFFRATSNQGFFCKCAWSTGFWGCCVRSDRYRWAWKCENDLVSRSVWAEAWINSLSSLMNRLSILGIVVLWLYCIRLFAICGASLTLCYGFLNYTNGNYLMR